MHPVTGWYLAQARHDELMRGLARPRVARPERPKHHPLQRIGSDRQPVRSSRSVASAAGGSLPKGCAA